MEKPASLARFFNKDVTMARWGSKARYNDLLNLEKMDKLGIQLF